MVDRIQEVMDIETKLTQLSDERISNVLQKYIDKWGFDIEWSTLLVDLKSVFQIEHQAELDEKFGVMNTMLLSLGSELTKRKMMNTQDGMETLVKYNNLLEKVYYAKYVINHFEQYKRTGDQGYDFSLNVDQTMFKFKPLVYDQMKPFQKLIFKFFDFFAQNNYRKCGEYVYEEITTPYSTHAWKQKCKIIEIINKECSMIYNLPNWYMLTSQKDMDKQLQEYFTRCSDSRFPELEKNRHVFSFKNGIYFANSTEATGIKMETSHSYKDMFVAYGSDDFKLIATNVTACKYFDMDFRCAETEIDEISTPILDSIYNYQGLSDEVIKINKMFLGRMLYNVGHLENWQVIMMLLGSGGSGKSTITNIVRMFYASEDVGIMGNNFSKTFGLSDICDKFAFIAPEIKKDWGIDQAEFQEIVSGGRINVNVKHQASRRVEWVTPGLLAGNENPGFVDNACSIQRRVVVTRFDKKVDDGDPQLCQKLELEIDCIIKQCNMYYLEHVNRYQNKDIWKWLPDYYLETQKMMAAASNALYAFMDSDILEFNEDSYIPMDEFFKRFNLFCMENNFLKSKINVDFYRTPFNKYKIELLTKCTKQYPTGYGKLYKSINFLKGVDIKLDDQVDDNDIF